jgi:hypothetical protein
MEFFSSVGGTHVLRPGKIISLCDILSDVKYLSATCPELLLMKGTQVYPRAGVMQASISK